MFSNFPRMNKIDLNMLELWQIVGKKYNFNTNAFVGFIVSVFNNAQTWITLMMTYLNTPPTPANKNYPLSPAVDISLWMPHNTVFWQ